MAVSPPLAPALPIVLRRVGSQLLELGQAVERLSGRHERELELATEGLHAKNRTLGSEVQRLRAELGRSPPRDPPASGDRIGCDAHLLSDRDSHVAEETVPPLLRQGTPLRGSELASKGHRGSTSPLHGEAAFHRPGSVASGDVDVWIPRDSSQRFKATGDQEVCGVAEMVPAHDRATSPSEKSSQPTGVIEMLPLWAKKDDSIMDKRLSSSQQMISIRVTEVQEVVLSREHQRKTQRKTQVPAWEKFMQKLIFHPDKAWRISWDSLGGALISYDVVTIPLQVFELPQSLGLSVMDWLVAVYWSVDVFHRFFIGFSDQGIVELRPRRIARHYIHSWFFPDFFVVLIDWICLVAGLGGQATRSWRIARSLRALRVLRVFRLIRLIKFARLLRKLIDCIQSEQILICTKIFYVIGSIVLTGHYVGCYWYGMACWDGLGTSWVDEKALAKAPVEYLYLASLHWALAQSGLATLDVYPSNSLEQLYSILTTLLWIVVLPMTVSSITLWFLQMGEANLEFNKQESQMRRFLGAHAIPVDTTNLVLRFHRRYFRSRMRRVHEEDIALFGDLPSSLQVRLHKEMYLPTLKMHPVFAYLAKVNAIGILAVCHLAMRERHVDAGQSIFVDGALAHEMLFVVAGAMDYYPSGSMVARRVLKGEWISEAALWCRWRHAGHLVAATSGELLLLEAEKFCAVLQECESSGWPIKPLRVYATNTISKLFAEDPASDVCEWPTTIAELAMLAFENWEGWQHKRPQHLSFASLASNLTRSMTPNLSSSEGSHVARSSPNTLRQTSRHQTMFGDNSVPEVMLTGESHSRMSSPIV